MKQFCLYLCLFFSTALFAREYDVVWFDANWQQTTSKEQAVYFRVCEADSINQRYTMQDYYISGKLYRTGSFTSLNPEVRDGLFIWYFKNGRKQKEIVYSNNVVADWKVMNEKGAIQLSVVVDIKGPHDETLYEAFKVDKEPAFVGGKKALNSYIQKNLVYPAMTAIEPIDGIVLVYFIVNENGTVTDARIARSLHYELDKAALKLVEKMPAWSPGLVGNRSVAVPYILPVKFQNKSAQSYSRNESSRIKGNFSY